MEEQRIYASLIEYEKLLESYVWNDLKFEVNVWLEDIRSKLETEDDIGEIKRFQGIAEACRHFMNLPQSIVDALKVDRDGRSEL